MIEKTNNRLQAEYSISEYKSLYNTNEFRDLLAKYPELIKGITQTVEVTQKWLRDPEPETDPFNEDASLTYGNNLRMDFINSKEKDKYGNYDSKQVVYFEVYVGGQSYFLKAAPGDYHSGGVTEALATDFLRAEINKKKIEGVEVVDCIAAYQSGQNKYYLSKLHNSDQIFDLQGIIDATVDVPYGFPSERMRSVQGRVKQVIEVMKSYNLLDKASDHNMFYDVDRDIVLVFDINPAVTK